MDVPVPLAPVKPGVEHGLTFPRSVADLLGFGVSKIESMPEAKTQSQKLRAKGQEPSFSHTTATYLMAMCAQKCILIRHTPVH